MTVRPDAPAPDPVEERLRATLAAEAGRHPVTPDFERLRAEADRTVIDLHLPPRRNRARVVAAAAALALLAGTVVAVATRDAGDDEPVATVPPATGYYLPGAGWDVTRIYALPTFAFPGAARMVSFADVREGGEPDTMVDAGSLNALVTRVEESTPDLVAVAEDAGLADIHEVGRGDGEAARTYVVAGFHEGPSSEDDPLPSDEAGGSLIAHVDGQLLQVDWYGTVGEAAVIDLADRWWETGGDEIALDAGPDVTRAVDVTYPDADPVAVDDLVSLAGPEEPDDVGDLYASAPLQVFVDVTSPEGWDATYGLTAPGRDGRPTGYASDDGGADAGFGPTEVGAPLPESVGGPGAAWESGTGIFASLPGADAALARTTYVSSPLTPERARLLYAALAPVTREAWVSAVEAGDEPQMVEVDWAPTLADTAVDVDDLFGPAMSEDSGETFAEEDVATIDLVARDGVNPAAGVTADEADRLVADAVLAFSGRPGPLDADLFAATTTFVLHDDPTTYEVAIEEVAAGPDWQADPLTPATEAWLVLESVMPAEVADLLDAPGECPPLEAEAADPAVVVVYEDVSDGTTPCAQWVALVIHLDGAGQVDRVESRYSD